MSENWGVTSAGFRVPPWRELWEIVAQRWREEFSEAADLTHNSPEGHIFRVITEQLSNKGLRGSPIESLWMALADVYYSAYVLTATGQALDDVVMYRGLKRKPGSHATGTVQLEGQPGATVPSGTIVRTGSGVEFEIVNDVTLPASGVADARIRAKLAGVTGNVAGGTITEVEGLESENLTVSNALQQDVLHLVNPDASLEWATLQPEESHAEFQTIAVDDIAHPLDVAEITIHVRNPSTEAKVFDLQLLAVDHASGYLIGRSYLAHFALDGQQERALTWTDLHWSFRGFETVRLVLALHETSQGPLQVGIASEDHYPNGSWHLAGQEQAGYDLACSLTSQVGGPTSGGEDAESDHELRERYLKSLFRGGSATPNAVMAELWELRGVRDVKLLLDTSAKTVEAIVWGGDPDEIAEALLESLPAGIETVGNVTRTISDAYGQLHTLRFSRPTERIIYVHIEVERDWDWPPDGDSQVKDKIAEYIGGFDTNGIEHKGLGIGEDVSLSALMHKVHELDKVRSVSVQIGFSPTNLQDLDLELGPTELAITLPEAISVY